jgi:hypothetical protein
LRRERLGENGDRRPSAAGPSSARCHRHYLGSAALAATLLESAGACL